MSASTRVAIPAKNQLFAIRPREEYQLPPWPGTNKPREGPKCSKMPVTQTGTPILLLAIDAVIRSLPRRIEQPGQQNGRCHGECQEVLPIRLNAGRE